MKILTLANQKGGVGKSAVACQLAQYYAHKGKRILFIDLDHQMNSTSALVQNAMVKAAAFTSFAVLTGKAGLLPVSPFVLVRGEEALDSLERQPGLHQASVDNLVGFLNTHADAFDLCVIDTNPNPDIRYGAALIASNFILSPIQLNQEAIDGVRALLNHSRWGYHKLRRLLNDRLSLIGLLPNLVEATPFQRTNFQNLVDNHADLLIATDGPQRYLRIPKSTAIAESQSFGTYLPDVPKTSARDAFKELKTCFDVIAQRMALEI